MAELILLSTPIGNLGDLTENARILLENESYFLAEDTRMLGKLLDQLSIGKNGKNTRSFHDHNQSEIENVLAWIQKNERVVLVSDAGSPVISDPAYPLVKACYDNNIDVLSAPGVSSVIVALERSSLPPIPFHFHGFLAREKGKIESAIRVSLGQAGTHLYFESPHRIEKTVEYLFEFDEIEKVVLARELTKKFEEFIFLDKSNWKDILKTSTLKGEFVVLYSVNGVSSKNDLKSRQLAEDYMNKPTPKNLSKLLAEILDQKTSEIYQKLNQK